MISEYRLKLFYNQSQRSTNINNINNINNIKHSGCHQANISSIKQTPANIPQSFLPPLKAPPRLVRGASSPEGELTSCEAESVSREEEAAEGERTSHPAGCCCCSDPTMLHLSSGWRTAAAFDLPSFTLRLPLSAAPLYSLRITALSLSLWPTLL